MKENFDPKFDAAAKQEELQKFEKLYVYMIVIEFKSDAKAIKTGTKVVVTKKGIMTKPMIKARLVEKEFADETRKGELFAGTPGPSAPRYLVFKFATNMCGEERKCVGVMDVKSVFLHGRARRHIFIEVPMEDPRSQLDGVLAKVVGSLCGTRDVPMI